MRGGKVTLNCQQIGYPCSVFHLFSEDYYCSSKVVMIIHSAKYTGSFPKWQDCPKDNRPEFAFAGRSNVGKSSLINMLLQRKQLAKVSHTPGKTQLLNYFSVNDEWYLVDLPGYGYAKVSKTQRKNWEKMISQFLMRRENLQCVFALVDSRIPPQQVDIEFINSLGERQVPYVIVYTKSEKMDNKRKKNITDFETELLKTWEELPQRFITSSKLKKGREQILSLIEAVTEAF